MATLTPSAEALKVLLTYTTDIEKFWRHGAPLSPNALISANEATIQDAIRLANQQARAELPGEAQ